MKRPSLLLPLLLLGTVSALHLGKDALHQDALESHASLSKDLEGSEERQGELALPDEATQSEEEDDQDALEDEEDMESDPEEDLQCPSEEETVQLQGTPASNTFRYLLVRRPRCFRKAQRICRRCYRGNLVSIHNLRLDYKLRKLSRIINGARVWIGAVFRGLFRSKKFLWMDKSRWNFAYWAPGQPSGGRGHCVTLSTRGGHWRRSTCQRHLPFICSY